MKILMRVLLLFIGGVAIVSCKHSVIPLSAKEKEFESYLAKKYKCTSVISHDYYAINNSKNNGVLYLSLENSQNEDFCTKDSLFLKKLASAIVEELLPVLSYKKNYGNVDVGFEKYIIEGTHQRGICSRIVRVNITKNRSRYIRYWY
ncbi:hypothetical protein DVR12_07190 [Chitinophaga silvatica]|uniref:Lipoprotein n=1 Tax=Chitinophaga silvatica TaxID=2282649 RepID=A0A3E1YEJ1_9BACT|nr:hypothetical protein [Chitinophaga silvatica]RFS24965.1 hypothetical protein DVR12_07190 [Chitinophaga silvatica]